MSFYAPDPTETDREGPSILPEGRYDVTMTGFEGKRSESSGNPMLVVKYTIDSGEEAGRKLTDRFTFFESDQPAEQHPTWRRLAIMMADCAGYDWERANSIEAFAAQFPVNKLRVNVAVMHRYTVEGYIPQKDSKYNPSSMAVDMDDKHTKQVDYLEVTEKEWENWPEDRRNKPAAQVADAFEFDPTHIYREPQGEREIEFADDGSTFVASGDGAATSEPYATGPAKGGQTPEGEDDLPF